LTGRTRIIEVEEISNIEQGIKNDEVGKKPVIKNERLISAKIFENIKSIIRQRPVPSRYFGRGWGEA